MNCKKMSIITLCITLCLLIAVGGLIIFSDPYFHYHKPFDFQSYSLHNQRYQNDGITRHFEYNAIITGTSMTENFKTSELDELFSVNSIKIPFSGASLKEINDVVERAIERNPDVCMVLRSLDHYKLLEDKNYMSYSEYPDYLYDDNILNDTKYILNKDILLSDTYQTVMMTLKHSPSTTFDDYSNWNSVSTFGKEAVFKEYSRKEHVDAIKDFTEEDYKTVEGTVTQNIIENAKLHPDTEFYFFLPPYSMVYWDSLYTEGEIERHLEAQELAINMMLRQENIHVFSFMTDYETICNLDNYKDTTHYSEEINSEMLNHMKQGEYEVTKENCTEYFAEVYDYYTTYDYDSIFE